MEGHQRGTSARAAHDPRRPSLERPSLFAGSDDNLNEADGLRSVRILSTLESQERSKGPSLRGKGTRKTAPTSAGHGASRASRSQGLLWALVVGGLACAGGALWWAQAGHAPAAPVGARPATDPVAATAPARATHVHMAAQASAASAVATTSAGMPASASTAARPSATPLAALIETSPPAAGPSVLKITPAADRPDTSASATASQAQASATPAARASRERKAKAPGTTTAKASGQGDTPKRKDARKPASDRDVELLEAVMSHTERRPHH